MRRRRCPTALLASVLFIGIAIFFPNEIEALNANHPNCSTCHNLHGSTGQTLTDFATSETLCLSCHGPAGISTFKASIHTNKPSSSYPPFTMSCMKCHNPHDNMPNSAGGTNLKMVGNDVSGNNEAEISTPNSGTRYVVFESQGTDATPAQPSLHSFADNDEDGNGYYDGVCETCHTNAANHRNNSSGNHAHYTGQDCIQCHPHDDGFLGSGGGCIGCHGSPTDKGDGGPTRRAISSEFTLTSHHVLGGTVTDADCGVCHYEFDNTAYHQDNTVDLKDPDLFDNSDPDNPIGLVSFAQFSRNINSDSLESWVTSVQNNFCLKCHDSNGAQATNLGNAMRPFSAGAKDVPNVYDRFDTGNSYHHAVRGAGNNDFCIPSSTNGSIITMEPPWNQDATHDVISCFDCHGASGHGGANQRMLRDPIDLDTMESGTMDSTWPDAIGLPVETFCSRCHKSSVYVSGSTGSKMEYHGTDMDQHAAGGSNNELGCMGCHGGIRNEGAITNGSARGNLHGGSFTWGSGSWSSGSSTKFFMVGGWLSGWKESTQTKQGIMYNGCGGGNCNHSGNVSQQRPGQDYTQIAD